MRALWAIFVLNTLFTATQFVGARAANSLALMGDTGTMAIDSLTYAINLAAEYHKEKLGAKQSAMVEICASLVSVVALIAVTVFVIRDALERLNQVGEEGESEEVNPVIMLVFTSVNLLMDFAMCASIVLRSTGGLTGCLAARCCSRNSHCQAVPRSEDQSAPSAPTAEPVVSGAAGDRTAAPGVHAAMEAGDEPHADDADGALADGGASVLGLSELNVSAKDNLNLCSAFAHVLADTMRTLTEMLCGLIIAVTDLDSERTDALGSLVVCGVILFVAAYISYEAAVQARDLNRDAAAGQTAAHESRTTSTGGGTGSSSASTSAVQVHFRTYPSNNPPRRMPWQKATAFPCEARPATDGEPGLPLPDPSVIVTTSQ